MRKLNLLSLLIALVCSIPASLQAQTFEATLTGTQEVLPVETNASGEVTAVLAGNVLTVDGTFDNLSSEVDTSIAGGAHLHMGFAGENGPVQFALTASLDPDLRGGSFSAAANTFTLSASQVEALNDHQIYVNIHTLNYPGGELRGQLLPQTDAHYMANLFGSYEVPSIISEGSGSVVIERTGNDIRLSGSFKNLSSNLLTSLAGGAHVHFGYAGENGGVILPLNISVGGNMKSGIFHPDSNSFSISSQEVQMMDDRQLYVNVHSQNYNGGELRGQITGIAQRFFRAYLSGANQIPTRFSTASGQVIGEWNDGELIVSGSFDGLMSEIDTSIAGGGHLHAAPAGRNGSVIIPLSLDLKTNGTGATLGAGNNTYTTSPTQDSLLASRGTYVNIHTVDNPAGAIRGQMLGQAQAYFSAYTAGINQLPPVLTRGYGVVNMEKMDTMFRVSGSFDDLGSDLNVNIAGGGHIHSGLAGESGPVLAPVNIAVDGDNRGGVLHTSSNIFAAGSAVVNLLLNRALYINIHSMDYPNGELRGQLLPEAPAYFNAPLSGTAQTNPVQSMAMGNVVGEWKNGTLTLSGSFSGVNSEVDTSIAGGAHLHEAMAGSNGNVIQPLNIIFNNLTNGAFLPGLNTYGLDTAQASTLASRGFYINVHSNDHPSGELRGQLMPKAEAYFTTNLSGFNEVDPVSSPAQGGLKGEVRGDELVLTGSFADMTAAVDTSIVGGAHLHSGGIDENGSVSIPINGSYANDLMSGQFMAGNNTFALDSMAVANLFDEGLYANIHSTNFGGGELRGQLLKEGNNFPTMPSITDPSDGAMITVSSQSTDMLTINWDMAMDTNGNELAYVWSVASDSGLSTPIIADNVGDANTTTLPFSLIDSMLNDAGVDEGDTITLYHGVAASDGSVQNWSDIFTISVARDEGVGINNKDEVSLKIYPNPAETHAAIKISADKAIDEPLLIMDMSGKVVYRQQLNAAGGTLLHNISLSSFNSGMYLMQMGEGENAITRKLVVE